MLHAVVCEDLAAINHGNISYSLIGSPKIENSTAVYTCNIGYVLTGDSARICEFNASGSGEWNGTEPSCNGDLVFNN